MSDGYEEDLAMYGESAGAKPRVLDNEVLLRPISSLRYPKKPLSVASSSPAKDALARMTEKRIGAVLVVDDGRVVGIFTERDALMKGLYAGGDINAPVSEYMTADPDCLTPHDPIAFAMNRMGLGGYRHMPLVDGEHRPVGMLVMRDVVRYIAAFFPAEALNLPPHSEHDPPERNIHGG